MNNKFRKLISNLSYAFGAQGLSLGVSVILSFILPKFIGVTAFGYWQLFIFYTTYAGFFHLGLTDGIYLRTGGKKYEELDHSLLGTEMKFLNLFQVLVAFVISILIIKIENTPERRFVIISFLIYMIIFNSVAYLGYIFQAVNRTKDYSKALIIEKTCCLLAVIATILLGIANFECYIMIYIICDGFALLYCIWKGRKIVFSPFQDFAKAFQDIKINITIGIKLLIANLASLLIIGFNRVLIDYHWGIEEFGKFSMALSLTNFFLLFITQISMVLFPVLRQTDNVNMKKYYTNLRNILFILLPMIFLAYFPLQIILKIWLPQYAESFRYLIFLLPICIYDGRMQMLCTTYFKVLRKEKFLLVVNIVAMFISCLLGSVGTFYLNNVYVVIFAIVISIVIRNLLSEIYLGKEMNSLHQKDFCSEMLLIIFFIIVAWNFKEYIACIFYIGAYSIYLYRKKDTVKGIIKTLQISKGKKYE